MVGGLTRSLWTFHAPLPLYSHISTWAAPSPRPQVCWLLPAKPYETHPILTWAWEGVGRETAFSPGSGGTSLAASPLTLHL